MTENLVMKKGQWLTHENGDLYARALRDIPYHSVIMSSDFEMTHGGHPLPSEPIPRDVIKLGWNGNAAEVCIDGVWKRLGGAEIEPTDDAAVSPAQPIGADHD